MNVDEHNKQRLLWLTVMPNLPPTTMTERTMRLFGLLSVFALVTAKLDASQQQEQRDFIAAMQAAGVHQQPDDFREHLLRAARPVPDDYRRQLDAQYQSIDLSQYALKYIGCQNIHTWSDDAAENGAYAPLAMDRFAIFRLCDKGSCSAYNKWGCNYEYGEYVIPLEEYLYIMANYHLNQVKKYCQVCSACVAAEESYQTAATDDGGNDDNGADDGATAYTDDAAQHNANYYTSQRNDDDWAGYNRYWGESGYYENEGHQDADDGGGGDDDAGDDDYYADDVTDDGGGNGRRAAYGDDASGYYKGDDVSMYASYNNNDDGGSSYSQATDDQQTNDDGGSSSSYSSGGSSSSYSSSYNSAYLNSNGECKYSTVCSDYQSACSNYAKATSSSSSNSLSDYFQCTSFNIGNNVGYVGPHCRSDGRTIGIGIYADQHCSRYIGDIVDIGQYLTVDDSAFQMYYGRSCISCEASEAFSLLTDDQVGQASSVYPLCYQLYETSAKCQLHFADNEQSYQSQQQASTEQAVCNFIDSLVEKNYDEYGEVIIREDFDFANWKSGEEYVKLARKASTLQIILLVGSIVLSLGLFFYSCYLHKKLMFRKPWIPPSRVTGPYSGMYYGDDDDARSEAGRLSRLNSGIIAIRTATSVEGGASQTGGYTAAGDVSSLTPSNGAYTFA